MAPDSPSAAVHERLDRLRLAYREAFPPERAGGCCVCVLEARERTLLESMVAAEVQGGQTARLDDTFVALQSGGAGGEAYARDLGAELADMLAAQATELERLGLMAATYEHAPQTNTLAEVVGYLAFVLRQVGRPGQRQVLFLHPADVHDAKAFARQLDGLLAAGLPPGIILLVAAAEADPLVSLLTRRAYPEVTFVRPALDVHGLYREMLAERVEDTNDPGARFSLLMIDLAEYGGRGDFARMRAAGHEALAICEAGGPAWAHLRVGVFTGQGGLLLASRPHREESVGDFERGVDAARAAVASGNASGPGVLAQALQTLGAAHIQLGDFDRALGVYVEAVDYAAASPDLRAAELEARRSRALCLDQGGDPRAAYEAYEHTLDIAEETDPQVRQHSSLPYVGSELLRLARQLGRPEQVPAIRARMVALLGDEWDAHLDADGLNYRRA